MKFALIFIVFCFGSQIDLGTTDLTVSNRSGNVSLIILTILSVLHVFFRAGQSWIQASRKAGLQNDPGSKEEGAAEVSF